MPEADVSDFTYSDLMKAMAEEWTRPLKVQNYCYIVHPSQWNGFSYVWYDERWYYRIVHWIANKLHWWKLLNKLTWVYHYVGLKEEYGKE